jgi:predicted lipoprotein with Yx(FWY)xxD motif
MRLASTLAAAALLLAACAQAGSGSGSPSAGGIEITVSQTSAGDALAGADGMTLYVFANDTDDTSNCNGECGATWPPLIGDGSDVVAGSGVSGTFGTTTRDDGSLQVTHNGQPLYYYSGDEAAGDATGDGIGGVWSIAPVGEATASQPAASQPASNAESAEPMASGPGY